MRLAGRFLLVCLSIVQIACSDSGPITANDGDLEATVSAASSFATFESGQVRPLALSTDGTRLFATNTPNGSLEIFAVDEEGLQPEHSVPVGMEPVSVALFGETQAWVVNHLSDSVSIVDLVAQPPRVIKTLLVGDEPRDIVFAGEDNSRAFITTAHRGQNGPDDQPIDAQLFAPSVGRADVWVFDADDTGDTIGGDPVTVLSMFGDTPRALTTSPDGSTVYAAVMHSGNQTTAIGENGIAKRGPIQSSDGAVQPDTGLILKFDGTNWRDDTGQSADLNNTNYDSLVKFSLPDHDVFVISAVDEPRVVNQLSGVGTTLFNMVTNPVTGVVYVSNTDANNLTRFEGEGHAGATVRGNIAQSRVTVIDGSSLIVVNLNKHLDRSQASATDEQRQQSLAQPMGMAVSADGSTLYVAAFVSEKVAVYNTSELANNSFEVSDSMQIALGAGGPTGLVLDEASNRLYVMTRFNNSIVTIDTRNHGVTNSTALYNPEPDVVVAGRPFLYNATELSSHGDASCGMCHVFGDVDGLAWDLGNPDEEVVVNPNRFVNFALTPPGSISFHPLKGPMTTQSLRGLAGQGPMHWRGDRTGASATNGESIERAAFREFNIAFPQLLGTDSLLSDADMSAFADFALEIQYPPNPIRALDNSLTASQTQGQQTYMQDITTGEQFTCNDCHTIDVEQGQFGTDGGSSIEGPDISQEFKVPHLRNMYQKVGKFGNSGRFSGNDSEFGDQIKGFGFMHDGNMDTLDNFLQGDVFVFDQNAETNAIKRQQVVDFVMAIDSDHAPVVGQQITLDSNSDTATYSRLDLLLERAAITRPRPECELIAKGVVQNVQRGFVLIDANTFQSDRESETYTVAQMKNLAVQEGGAMTFTCVPPGSGLRMGIDQNNDGIYNGNSDNDVAVANGEQQ